MHLHAKLDGRRSLRQLPAEVLDEVPGYLDGQSMVRLGHAMRHFRPTSSAMHQFGRHYSRPADLVWPHPELTTQRSALATQPLLAALLRANCFLVLRSATIADLLAQIEFIPRTLILCWTPHWGSAYTTALDMARTLADAQLNVRAFDVLSRIREADGQAWAQTWARMHSIRYLQVVTELGPHAWGAVRELRGLRRVHVGPEYASLPVEDLLANLPLLVEMSFQVIRVEDAWFVRLVAALERHQGPLMRLGFWCGGRGHLLDKYVDILEGWRGRTKGFQLFWERVGMNDESASGWETE
ncbi:hypothetical protein BC830DRAFT_838426 [Chytriomyces sp. MP71]|nr:hypothetical protein BC830DRAFT_838426 [Chytriomyces sp. MP71]